MVKQHKKKHENDEEIDAGRADINMKLKHFCSVFLPEWETKNIHRKPSEPSSSSPVSESHRVSNINLLNGLQETKKN